MKRKLNSDGQQIHKTNIKKTNNHLSLQTIEDNTTTYKVGNLDPGWGQAQQCVVEGGLMGFQPSLFW
jgi:hypothetical protein